MIRGFVIFFALFLLTGCTSIHNALTPTPREKKVVFIDSNITADVYIGDVKVGRTPYMDKLSGEERKMISLHKAGYKTADLPLRKVDSGFSNLLQKNYAIREAYNVLDSSDLVNQFVNENGYDSKVIYYGAFKSIYFVRNGRIDNEFYEKYYKYRQQRACAYVGRLIKELDSANITENTVIRIEQQCRNEDRYQYDRDSYFVEMIPENKKSFTKEELKQIRVNLMLEN